MSHAAVDPAALRYDERGLVPVVVQEIETGAVLMVAWADRQAVERTLATGEAHFWSRSRGAPWRKGETSGNRVAVADVIADCDADTLLYRARPSGPACHRGTHSCFATAAIGLELQWLQDVVASRRGGDTRSSYSARLLAAGRERIAQKVGEEATETVIAALAAARDGTEARAALIGEVADLLFHLTVLLEDCGVAGAEVAAELGRRHAARREQP